MVLFSILGNKTLLTNSKYNWYWPLSGFLDTTKGLSFFNFPASSKKFFERDLLTTDLIVAFFTCKISLKLTLSTLNEIFLKLIINPYSPKSCRNGTDHSKTYRHSWNSTSSTNSRIPRISIFIGLNNIPFNTFWFWRRLVLWSFVRTFLVFVFFNYEPSPRVEPRPLLFPWYFLSSYSLSV